MNKNHGINGTKIFNLLSNDIKQCNNVNEFSKKLKCYLLDRPYYSLKGCFEKMYG
jgi:hypothetical protein